MNSIKESIELILNNAGYNIVDDFQVKVQEQDGFNFVTIIYLKNGHYKEYSPATVTALFNPEFIAEIDKDFSNKESVKEIFRYVAKG